MRKIVIVAILLALIIVLLICFSNSNSSNEQLLRIHIRANSNNDSDQQVKYIVKQCIVDYLVPYIASCNSVQDAMTVVSAQLQNIENLADATLSQYGYDYCSSVSLCQEYFPDRVYDGVAVPSGVYDALIVELGTGSGDNWWCVVYPPLCFVGSEGSGNSIVYQSILYQLISQWYAEH